MAARRPSLGAARLGSPSRSPPRSLSPLAAGLASAGQQGEWLARRSSSGSRPSSGVRFGSPESWQESGFHVPLLARDNRSGSAAGKGSRRDVASVASTGNLQLRSPRQEPLIDAITADTFRRPLPGVTPCTDRWGRPVQVLTESVGGALRRPARRLSPRASSPFSARGAGRPPSAETRHPSLRQSNSSSQRGPTNSVHATGRSASPISPSGPSLRSYSGSTPTIARSLVGGPPRQTESWWRTLPTSSIPVNLHMASAAIDPRMPSSSVGAEGSLESPRQSHAASTCSHTMTTPPPAKKEAGESLEAFQSPQSSTVAPMSCASSLRGSASPGRVLALVPPLSHTMLDSAGHQSIAGRATVASASQRQTPRSMYSTGSFVASYPSSEVLNTARTLASTDSSQAHSMARSASAGSLLGKKGRQVRTPVRSSVLALQGPVLGKRRPRPLQSVVLTNEMHCHASDVYLDLTCASRLGSGPVTLEEAPFLTDRPEHSFDRNVLENPPATLEDAPFLTDSRELICERNALEYAIEQPPIVTDRATQNSDQTDPIAQEAPIVESREIQNFGQDETDNIAETLGNQRSYTRLPTQEAQVCPRGHDLIHTNASSGGTCDMCSCRVKLGECIQECALCNWWKCSSCMES